MFEALVTFLSTIARCKVEPSRPLCSQLNLRDLTGIRVCVTMHWIYPTPSRSHCLPKGVGSRFCMPLPSARTAQLSSFLRTVLTPPCLVNCIIASATSRTLTSGNSIVPTSTAGDLLNDSAAVTSVLHNLVAWVFCGDKANGLAESEITAAGEKVTVVRDKTHRHIMSVAQDVVHITTQGRVRTLKHFMLPLTVQHLHEVGSWLLR